MSTKHATGRNSIALRKSSWASSGSCSSGRLAALISLVGLQILGCTVSVEGYSLDETAPSVTATEGQAVMGDNTYPGCSTTDRNRLIARQREGRMVSRSSAFLECVAYGAHDGVPQHLDGDDQLGPYEACSNDPIPTATMVQQIARLTSMSVNRLATVHTCNPNATCSGDGSFTACAGKISPGQNQAITWKHTNTSSGLIWHEIGHNHGYQHCEKGMFFRNCMVEVVAQSAASPECANLSCGANEMPIVKRYGQYGNGDPCECVPDVFNWPTNQNAASDRFGQTLATGDFDDDGYDDLAVGAPQKNGNGVVYVFRGSFTGLRFWKRLAQPDLQAIDYDQDPPLHFVPEETGGDDFGGALAAGDLNGDGYDELMIGTPGRNSDRGGVLILAGSAAGPSTQNVQWMDQTDLGHANSAGHRFGAALAVGNFNGDSRDDLAIGTPFRSQHGVVYVLRGVAAPIGSSPFAVKDGDMLQQEMGPWQNETGDEFGRALAVGDLDNDDLDELLIGAPGENGGVSGVGAVYRAEKVSGTWDVTAAITPPSAVTVRFGQAVAIGDLLGESGLYEDFAVGAPATGSLSGTVFVYQSSSGLTPTLKREFIGNQGSNFGAALAIGNVIGTSKADLIVGQPQTEIQGVRTGRFSVYAGAASNSFTSIAAIVRNQSSLYAVGANDTVLPPEGLSTDQFARSLAIGKFDGNGVGLAVGSPSDRVEGTTASGAVFTFSPQWVAGRKIDQVTMRHGTAWPPY